MVASLTTETTRANLSACDSCTDNLLLQIATLDPRIKGCRRGHKRLLLQYTRGRSARMLLALRHIWPDHRRMAASEADGANETLLMQSEPADGEPEAAVTTKAKPVTDRTLLIAFGVMVAVGIANNIFRVLQFGPMQPVSKLCSPQALPLLRHVTSTSHFRLLQPYRSDFALTASRSINTGVCEVIQLSSGGLACGQTAANSAPLVVGITCCAVCAFRQRVDNLYLSPSKFCMGLVEVGQADCRGKGHPVV